MSIAFAPPAIPHFEPPPGPFAEALFTRIGTAVDASLLGAVKLVVERALIPKAGDLEALRRSAGPLLEPALQRQPERYFDFSDADALPLRVSSRVRRALADGRVIDRRVTTRYRPHRPADTGAAESRPGPIRLTHWTHDHGSRGTVLALHGFAMGRPAMDAVALFAQQWYDAGLDVALMTLPHHGARTPSDARFSGDRFAVPDATRLGEAVREAVYEVQVVTRWLRQTRDAPVGLLGLSLGGYLAALAAGLSDDFDFVIPIVPPVCMGDLAWRFFERTRHYRDGHPASMSYDELRAAFRIHSPLAHPLRLPADRVLIVAGRGDRVVPPDHPHALWEHWGRPSIHWFGGSHLAPFGRGRIIEAILRHLRKLDLA